MRSPIRTLLYCSLALCVVSACAGPAKQPTYRRNVALWASESAEFTAVALQTYTTAQKKLVDALADPSWTASLEQRSDYQDLPPAIIVDLDETVLDNRPFQMGLIQEGVEFDEKSWNEWIEQASVEAIPGAVPFLQHAHRLGVEIFYVTNRSHTVEAATRRNLEALGLPLNEDLDTLLTKYEQPQWSREKTRRRKLISDRYRVLLILGDNLGDFMTEKHFSRGGRRQMVLDHQEMWGAKWFMLPNPLYGGWVAATIEDTERTKRGE